MPSPSSNPHVNISARLLAGCVAGIAFCTPLFFYLKNVLDPEAWILYLGCFLFFSVVVIHAIIHCRNHAQERTINLIFASYRVILIGAAVACIGGFILLCTLVPGYLPEEIPGNTLTGEPTNTVFSSASGHSFQTLLVALLICCGAGSLIGIIIPLVAKRTKSLKVLSARHVPNNNLVPGN